MATVIINVSVSGGKVVVSPNPAKASVGDTVKFVPADGVTIDAFAEGSGSVNVFSTLPSKDNNWTGTISSNARGEAEKYKIKANGISHDPEIDIES